ncbi:ricin-type beta-trefoil lectin domain protein [Actinoplanes hulinensis]|uniref:Ricin-type beta-trefoil lectin domain protein n=1 Tax=Actinoplanes hulinensis TaxID=1144547 RepID=A0ABS7B1W0_9ACTN|nr:RICIN domain-containing protein [Actinoplanes hulinensis]MBW6434970.1 ricin-type beta-trefoil lectin domain protein [Actinoplanes hulinensis]
MRRALPLCLAVPALVVGLFALPSEAAVTPVAGGVYTLASGSSAKCVQAAGTANGGLLTQIACNTAATSQLFTAVAQNGAFGFTDSASGKCVDIPYSDTTAGVQLWQWTCGASANQTWSLTASTAAPGKYLIKSASNGLCVSNKDGSTAGNNPIVQEACSDIARMQWSFTAVGTTPGSWSNTADGFAQGTTGGAGGTAVTVTNFADLVKYATASTAHVIRVSGTITVTPYGHEIPVTSNKTIVGLGTTGRIKNGGFFLGAGVKNVIIRNLTIGDTAMASDDPDDKDFDYDGIQMDTASNVWIDHNTFTNINDGYIDSRKDSTHITVSWNRMGDHNKTFGIGWTTNVTARMTIHHNWIYNSNQRNPSADNLQYAHLYNNYLNNVTSYGNYARGATRMVIENSYFDKVNNPYYPDTATGAQLRQSGSTVVNSTGRKETSGSAFTPGSFYSYTLTPTADVPTVVKASSGPQAGIVM